MGLVGTDVENARISILGVFSNVSLRIKGEFPKIG